LKKKPEAASQDEEAVEIEGGPLSPSLERVETAETDPRTSTDEAHARAPPPRRRPSKGTAVSESHDGNEADLSGAGDTTEGQDDTTEREDNEENLRQVSRVLTTSTTTSTGPHRGSEQEPGEEEEEEEQEEDEEEEVDPEVKRKEELRARMAKMSGGMGFHGMFGAPIPPMTKAPPKRRATKPMEATGADEDAQETTSRAAPPVPTPMALPGMGSVLAPSRGRQEEELEDDSDGDGEEATPVQSRTAPPPVPSREHKVEADDEDEEDVATPATTSEVASMYKSEPMCHDEQAS
jgi:hypothetical protein